MTKEECEQIARIIRNVFQHEEQISPETIAKVFELIGTLIANNNLKDDL